MAFPNRSQIQTATPLSNLSVKIANDPNVFQGRAIFPVKTVAKGTGKIRVYSRANLRVETAPAGRRSVAPEIERAFSLMPFETKEEALRELLLDKDVRDADADIADMRLDSTADLTEKLMLSYEKASLEKAFTAANFATGYSSTLAKTWSDPTSDPLKDITAASEAVRLGLAGRKPKSLAIDMLTWYALRDHPVIVDRVKYVAPGVAVVREDTVAQVLDLDEIIVLGAVHNTAAPDVSDSATMAPLVVNKQALLFYRGSGDGLRTVGFGRTLVPTGGEFRTKVYREGEAVEGEFVEVRQEYALQFLAVDDAKAATPKAIGGYLFGATAA